MQDGEFARRNAPFGHCDLASPLSLPSVRGTRPAAVCHWAMRDWDIRHWDISDLMPHHEPLASHAFDGDLESAFEFLKRTRSELRSLRKVRVWTDHLRVYDVNGDCFEITGVGYPDAAIVELLRAINTAFKPDQIHRPVEGPFKEFMTGRRYPWAQDRVM